MPTDFHKMNGPDALSLRPHIASLHHWVAEVVQEQRWNQYEDLHVDVLDKRFRKPGQWVEVGLLLLTALLEIVDQRQYDILLAIPLASSSTRTGVDTLPEKTLESYVGVTPPSCYLFPIDFPALSATLQTAIPCPALAHALQREVYFKETWEDESYQRVLFIKAANTRTALGGTHKLSKLL